MIEAVFFDMDGTIANSEIIVWKVTRVFMEERGIYLKPHEEKMLYGLIWKDFVRVILESRGQKYKQSIKNALKERYVRHLKKEVTAVPYIYDLLAEAKKNFKVVLATNSRLREVRIIFERLNFHNFFDLKLARDHIKNIKPHPEIYLKGAQLLKVDPSQCVVFEDSIVGVAAAKAAGMKCVGFINTHSKEDLQKADLTIKSYREMSVRRIMSLA